MHVSWVARAGTGQLNAASARVSGGLDRHAHGDTQQLPHAHAFAANALQAKRYLNNCVAAGAVVRYHPVTGQALGPEIRYKTC